MKPFGILSWRLLGLSSRSITALLAITLFSAQAHAEPNEAAQSQGPQEMRLESEVKGQRSQPKVLFILPWEDKIQADTIQLDDSLISEEDFLAPIDRVVFQEQINMYKQLEINP